ncbi:hypothetical protein [Streptosporangium lutulentum]|uniref:Heavy metal transporter n=1 Tax=Streptosporangium lutulentum TaxID=1461250 RepID=A0ABT9QQN4_9ACTN|nr:hypothetical protein [Streptosporangium lutulentum]MDP9849068.1 hypothetical protein [Streptosporangium lutulentum]
MRRRFSKGVIAIIAIVIVLAVAITVGLLKLLNRVTPLAGPVEGCAVTTPIGSLDLDIEQAQVAATIATVAARRKLPERAVVIAYATAIQESKLLNLESGDGDRDSVGVFQQRPSQGWGKPSQLIDPIYASGKFFSALVKVKNYRKLPLHEAAQEVQRSADGSAYAQHEDEGKILAAAFTGRVPKAVHCWFSDPTDEASARPATDATSPPAAEKARRKLVETLGPGTTLKTSSSERGWLMASWSVAHAQKFGLRLIRYDGQAWTSTTGREGWKADAAASTGRVEIS